MVGGVNLCLELTPIPVRDTQRAQGLINPTIELPEPIQDWEFGLWMEVHAIAPRVFFHQAASASSPNLWCPVSPQMHSKVRG